MKKKVIDVKTTSSNMEEISVLCVEQSNVDQLMAILQLCPVGGTVQIHVYEVDVPSPFDGGFVKEENA